MGTKPQIEPIIETSPIRLSVDETRILMRIMAAGKPVRSDNYQYSALAELGILARIEVKEEKEHARQIDECWKRAKTALRVKDHEELHQAMHDLEKLNSDRHREQNAYLYELSPLGKQIARGISVRMNAVKR